MAAARLGRVEEEGIVRAIDIQPPRRVLVDHQIALRLGASLGLYTRNQTKWPCVVRVRFEIVDDDIVGSNVSTTNDFPAGLADECARAFARAFTANDGTITLMTPNLAGQHASPAAVTCETLVTGGYTKTVCDEACAEFVKLVGRLLSEAGCDTFDVGVYGKLIKCLSMNAGAKLLRQHGLLAHGAISSIAADDADGRDRELAEKHMLQLRHTIAVGVTSGKPAVHIISNAFVATRRRWVLALPCQDGLLEPASGDR